MKANPENGKRQPAASAAPGLENLIPIVVAVAAGCERCAKRLVQRALEGGSPQELIERTLRIVAGLRSRECFTDAVGPEAIERMTRALEAGRAALRDTAPGLGCCSQR